MYEGKKKENGKKRKIYLVHREYPTNFRYDKDKLLNEDFTEPYPLYTKKGRRGNYDLAILDQVFVKNADSFEDIVNRDLRLLVERTKNNKHFENSKELLFAFEFKYITNNSKVYIDSIKMDNKKLLFAKKYGGAKEAVNLTFCNNNYHYLKDLKETIKNTGKEVLSILIQSYFNNEGKKKTPIPLIMNKDELKIK